MKPSTLLLMSLITIIITSFFWLFVFHDLPLSHKTDDWSNFGSYIGGVAGPALSFISILLVIETIKQTQKNHKQQVSLIMQEQTYSKFQDLCSFLESTVQKGWLNTQSGTFESLIHTLKTTVIFHESQKIGITTSQKHAIALEVTQEYLSRNLFLTVGDVAVILKSINKFIFMHNPDDKELMINMIELKLTKEQRLIIYVILKRTYPEVAELIDRHWGTFCVYPWGD